VFDQCLTSVWLQISAVFVIGNVTSGSDDVPNVTLVRRPLHFDQYLTSI
jgi:hypothetical protein